jgi:hypothetical protein
MRGKKTDPLFLSNFISECINEGIDTPDQIAAHAKKMITKIDDQIKEVEQKKITRSKLLDVITAFEQQDKTSKQEEAKILPFFKIQNPQICKIICDHVKIGIFTLDEIINIEYTSSDILFCIKQLREHKIISKSGNHICRGAMFDEYAKFVLKE